MFMLLVHSTWRKEEFAGMDLGKHCSSVRRPRNTLRCTWLQS